jgi:translation initiation factor IF-3
MHSDVGLEVMNRMADKLEEVGVVDSQPKVMGRQMIMTVTPKQQQK